MINNLPRDELLDNVDMTVMNGVKCPAVEPEAQCELLIETKNDIQEKCEDTECNKPKCVWWKWKFAMCFRSEINHERRLLLTSKKF